MPHATLNQAELTAGLETAAALSCSNITKSFRPVGDGAGSGAGLVLDDIDFIFPAGKIIGLVGRTGVGKTTFGRVLGGLLRPDRGAVSLAHLDIFACTPEQTRLIRHWLRFVPQNPDAVLSDKITVAQALTEAAGCCRLPLDQQEHWRQLIENNSLFDPAWLNRPVSDLSLGQRRRVVNLRSLQTCPKFIILDEPFNGLDLVTKRGMLDLLQAVACDYGVGVFFISHDVEALESVCEQVWLLADGKLAEYQSCGA